MEQMFEQMRRELRFGWPEGERALRDPQSESRPVVQGPWASSDDERHGSGTGNVRVDRTDDGVVVVVDLPGFGTDDIELRVVDGTLTVEAVHEERESGTDASGDAVSVSFQSRRAFERLPLPADIDADEATATYSNGVLEVRFPASESEDVGTSIDVETA